MIEKIDKVNTILEQIVLKLEKNYERLEAKVLQAERTIDEESTTSEYEALALLKKDAIMNKILYQYYSQKLRKVMDRAEMSIIEMAAITDNSESFEDEIRNKDFTNINLEELVRGVKSNAVTEEILSSFEMFSGAGAASKENSKIEYETNDSCNYDIKPTDDEYILYRVGSHCVPQSDSEFMMAGGDAQPITEELMSAGGSAQPLTYELLTAGGSAIPVDEKLKEAGGSVSSEMADFQQYAIGFAEPLTLELIQAGSGAVPPYENDNGGNAIPENELVNIGGDAEPISERLMHIGGGAEPLSYDLRFAGGSAKSKEENELDYVGGDAEPEEERLKNIGGDAEPLEEKMKNVGGDAKPKAKTRKTKKQK